MSKKLLLKIDENIFLSECDKIKKTEIPAQRIKENNIIKENIEKNVKLLNKKNDSNINKEHKNNNKINTNINGVTNMELCKFQ